jgi:hypothetical protein
VATTAERLKVELGVDATNLRKEFGNALKDTQKLDAGVGKLGVSLGNFSSLALKAVPALAGLTSVAGTLGLAFASVSKAINVGSELVDLRDRTGFAIESLSALRYAAGQTGASLADFETATKKMQKAIVEGSKKFDELGLSVTNLRRQRPEAQFLAIAEAISKLSTPAERTAAALEIFGKSGTSLLPLLKDGKNGIKALTDEAKRLGLVLSGEEAEAAEKFGDKLDMLKARGERLAVSLGTKLIPVLEKTVDAMTGEGGSRVIGADADANAAYNRAVNNHRYGEAARIKAEAAKAAQAKRVAEQGQRDRNGLNTALTTRANDLFALDKFQRFFTDQKPTVGQGARDLINALGLGPLIETKKPQPTDLGAEIKGLVKALDLDPLAQKISEAVKPSGLTAGFDTAGPFKGLADGLAKAFTSKLDPVLGPLANIGKLFVEKEREDGAVKIGNNKALQYGTVEAYSAEKSDRLQISNQQKMVKNQEKQIRLQEQGNAQNKRPPIQIFGWGF